MNKRIEELKKLSRDEVEALATSQGIRPSKTKIGTIRSIEAREFTDRRTAQKLPQIKKIF